MAAAPIALPPVALPAPADPACCPLPEAPRFHVARVSARGMLVTAGSAAPGAEVQLLEGGRELGRARADARGEWVILPGDPLPPGPKELSLLARSPGGDPIASRETLLLVVPEPQVAGRRDAGRHGDGRGGNGRDGDRRHGHAAAADRAAGVAPRPLQVPAEAAPGRQRLGLDWWITTRPAACASPAAPRRVRPCGSMSGATMPAMRWPTRPAAGR